MDILFTMIPIVVGWATAYYAGFWSGVRQGERRGRAQVFRVFRVAVREHPKAWVPDTWNAEQRKMWVFAKEVLASAVDYAEREVDR